MRKTIFAAIIGVIIIWIITACTSSLPTNTSPSTIAPPTTITPSSTSCDPSLWDHVYHSYRLQVISDCIIVTGIVDRIKSEPDGDTHISLSLDSAYANLVNSANPHGDLVVEEICVNDVRQSDAIAACEGFTPPAEPAIQVGDHIAVTGSYVTDTIHGWNEIHPVSKITEIS